MAPWRRIFAPTWMWPSICEALLEDRWAPRAPSAPLWSSESAALPLTTTLLPSPEAAADEGAPGRLPLRDAARLDRACPCPYRSATSSSAEVAAAAPAADGPPPSAEVLPVRSVPLLLSSRDLDPSRPFPASLTSSAETTTEEPEATTPAPCAAMTVSLNPLTRWKSSE